MLRRAPGLLLLSIFAVALAPAPAWSQDAAKEKYKKDVLDLSKRIDDYFEKRWKELKVTPAPLAEDSIYFRRLSLDINGKIPELTQVHDFLGNRSSNKQWEWTERFLAEEHYPKHFANVWRTTIIGRGNNPQFQGLYPTFEAWLKERLDKNIPADQIVRQILLAQTNPNMGFQPVGGGGGMAGNPGAFYQINENKPENLAGATSRVFLGVKLECAQCHAHPFAKWTKEQFWEFAAFYSNVAQQPRPAGGKQPKAASTIPGREIQIPGTEKVVKAKFLGGQEPIWGAFSDSRKVLADWTTSPENPYFARAMSDHLWSYFFGVSLLEPIMEPSDDSPVTHPELLDMLAKEFVAHKYDMKFLIRAMVHTKAYQRSSGGPALATKEDYHLFVRMPIRSLTPEQLYDSFWEATKGKPQQAYNYDPRFGGFPPGRGGMRGEFLNRFGTQDRRYDPQTSILQALFMMNSKYVAQETSATRNESLQTLISQPTSTERKVTSMYWMILSRPPRPEELKRMTTYVATGGPSHDQGRALEDVYWVLLNSSEFLLNH